MRETLRISANLASATAPPIPIAAESDRVRDAAAFGLVEEQFVNSSLRLICREEIDGRRWEYFADTTNKSKQFRKNSAIRVVSLHSPQGPVDVSS